MYIYMAVNCEEPGLASRGTKKQEGHHHLTRSQLRRSRRILTNARRKLASSGLKDPNFNREHDPPSGPSVHH